jgi:hypothetical protein
MGFLSVFVGSSLQLLIIPSERWIVAFESASAIEARILLWAILPSHLMPETSYTLP